MAEDISNKIVEIMYIDNDAKRSKANTDVWIKELDKTQVKGNYGLLACSRVIQFPGETSVKEYLEKKYFDVYIVNLATTIGKGAIDDIVTKYMDNEGAAHYFVLIGTENQLKNFTVDIREFVPTAEIATILSNNGYARRVEQLWGVKEKRDITTRDGKHEDMSIILEVVNSVYENKTRAGQPAGSCVSKHPLTEDII